MSVREGSNVVFVWWRQFGGEHNSGSATLNSSVFGSSIVDFFGVDCRILFLSLNFLVNGKLLKNIAFYWYGILTFNGGSASVSIK